MRGIEEWKKDFKEYINGLSLPRDDYKGIMEYIDGVPTVDAVQYTLGYQDGFLEGKKICERPQGDECMTNACYKKQNAKHCNTCLHYQQLTKIQEIGYCETKNCHVSANSDKCINYKEKQEVGAE